MLQAGIRRGELDRRLTFIEEVVSRGDSNQDKVISWTEVDDYPTVFARKREYNGKEMVINDQLKFVQTTEFIIVYRTDLTVKNRCVCEDRVYEIVSIVEAGMQRKSYLQIMASYLDNETVTLGSITADSTEWTADSTEITADQT